jgi:predicted nucleic acid-binding protein
MKVLLDTNVILDLMLERDPWRTAAEAIADANGRLGPGDARASGRRKD